MPNQSPLSEPLEAAEGVDVEPRLFHDVAVGDAADRLVADGAAGGHLAPRADAFEGDDDLVQKGGVEPPLAIQGTAFLPLEDFRKR